MSRKLEVPADPQGHSSNEYDYGAHGPSRGGFFGLDDRSTTDHRPATELQALMECAPGDEPMESVEEQRDLRDVLCTALESMAPQARWIVESCVSGRISLRELGRELSLSKTHVARLRDQAYEELREALGDDPTVLAHFARNHALVETEGDDDE